MLESNLKNQFKTHSTISRHLNTTWLEGGRRGQPIVFFCHGFPDDATTWCDQMAILSAKYLVIAPNVRGCAGSTPATDLQRYSPDAIFLDHQQIIAEVSTGQEPLVFVGHDLGVVHAMTLARRLGARTKGLVVINGLDIDLFKQRLQYFEQVRKSIYMAFLTLPKLPEFVAKFLPNSGAWLTDYLAGSRSNGSEPTDANLFRERALAPVNQYRTFFRDLTRRSLHFRHAPLSKAARLSQPVLVLWSRDDGVLSLTNQAEWDQVAVDATIRIIPGEHWLHREKPQEISKLMEDFVTGCFEGPSLLGDFLGRNKHDL